jgi:hypothetical protein
MVAVALAASLAMPDTRKHEYLEGEGQVENVSAAARASTARDVDGRYERPHFVNRATPTAATLVGSRL